MQYSVQPNDRVPYEIRHADDDLLVVNKPSGVVTQPGKRHEHDSLLHGLFTQYGGLLQNLGEERNWGLLHRLDKDTSGLVIIALRNRSYENLRRQFVDRLVRKTYWAVVLGCPKPAQGVIQKPITEIVTSRKKAVIKRDGKQAITAYRILQSAADVSLIEAKPKTGRLHQIRLHMASIGHPILGETIYAGEAKLPVVGRLCLHAAAISLIHPTTGHRLTVQSPWPTDLAKTLKRLGLQTPSGAAKRPGKR